MPIIDFAKQGIDIGNNMPGARRQIKCLCPKCTPTRSNKRDRSLSVNLATGEYNCHHCGWKGTAAVNTPDETQRWMKQQPWYRTTPPSPVAKTYTQPKADPAAKTPDGKTLRWFQGRGISEATLKALNVTAGPAYMPQKAAEAQTVQFNYLLDGKRVNTKYRTGDKCFKMVSGARLVPYNIDAIKDTDQCVITEGEMDTLSFVEAGRRDCISVPAGANANLEWLDPFMQSHFDGKKVIYIASDTDQKGRELAAELTRRLGAERCRIVAYAQGCKDANEQLQAHGAASLIDCLAAAKQARIDGVVELEDYEEALDDLYYNGLKQGATLGYPCLDPLISFETKRVCVITATPTSGKSEFAQQIAEALNVRYGWKWAFYSPENAPVTMLAANLEAKLTGCKFGARHTPLQLHNAAKRHIAANFFVLDPEQTDIDRILAMASALVRARGIKGLVIDPWNRLECDLGRTTETLYISHILDRIGHFARVNDVLVVIVAHPTKLPKLSNGRLPVPTLYDIAGSANFYNKCDYGIILDRDDVEGRTEVNVGKVKFAHLGSKGKVYLCFNSDNKRFDPWTDGQQPRDLDNHLGDSRRVDLDQALELDDAPLESVGDLPF